MRLPDHCGQFSFTCRLSNTDGREKRPFGQVGSSACLVGTCRKLDCFSGQLALQDHLKSKDQSNIMITHYHWIKSSVHPEDALDPASVASFSLDMLEGHLPWLCWRTACFLKNILLRFSPSSFCRCRPRNWLPNNLRGDHLASLPSLPLKLWHQQ